MAESKKAPPRSWDRLTELLWTAAEKGNVPAMRILREEMRAERGDQGTGTKDPIGSIIEDELEKRRNAGAG